MLQETPYKLVFAGPSDETPETLRKLRGVFIAELNCSIEEVQTFFENTPSVIRLAEDIDELKKALKLIEKAGGLASIEGLSNESEDQDQSIEEEKTDSTLEFSFSLDEIETATPQPAAEPKVYSLDFNPEQPSDLTIPEELFSFADDDKIEEQLAEEPTTKEETIDQGLGLTLSELSSELSFEEEQVEVPAVIETPSNEPPLNDTPLVVTESNEFDLSLSLDAIDQLPNNELIDSAAFDLNIAGENIDWDLSLDEKKEPLVASVEDIKPDLPPPASPIIEAPATSLLSFEADEKVAELEVKDLVEDLAIPEDLAVTLETESSALQEEAKLSEPQTVSEVTVPEMNVPETTPVEDTRGAISIVEQYQSAAVNNKRNSKKDVLFIACGFLLILNGYLVWNNFFTDAKNSRSGLSEESLEQMIKAAAKSAKLEAEHKAVLAANLAAADSAMQLVGKADTAEGGIEWNLLAKDNKIISGNFSFAAQKPPPLTKLEIGQGKNEHPWLYKVELNDLVFKSDEKGNFIAFTRARMFIESGQARNRNLGFSKIVLAYEPEQDMLAGSLIISSKEKTASGTNQLKIEKDTTDLYQVSVETEWVSSGGKIIPDAKESN